MDLGRGLRQRLAVVGSGVAVVAIAVVTWKLRRKRRSVSQENHIRYNKQKLLELPSPEATMQLLKSRRSLFPKDYNGQGRVPSREDVALLLEAANWAPTHKRNEPWRFVVFYGKEAIQRVCDATVEGNRAATNEDRGGETFATWHADFIDNGVNKKWSRCAVLIALVMLREAQPGKKLPEWEEIAAVACAVQNMHIMATSLGLACYWSSWNIVGRDSEDMAALLGISKRNGDRCLGFFSIGSSDKVGKIRSGRGSVQEKTRWVNESHRSLDRPAVDA